jgi:glycosyltransferase involved in cell wall biosynthesis
LPSDTGNGLAMRAGVLLEALAADHDVHLLVVPVIPGATRAASAAFAERWCAQVTVLDESTALDPLFELISRVQDPEGRRRLLGGYPRPLLGRFTHPASVADAAARLGGTRFRVVHVMRTYLADFATPWLEPPDPRGRPLCVLDADECESRTHRSLAALHALRGERGAADVELAEAEKYESVEGARLALFDRVLVASSVDAEALEAHVGHASLRVIRNSIRACGDAVEESSPSRREDAFTLLFVGTLDYLPNLDGCEWFCREVLPKIRDRAGNGLRVVIVGRGPGRLTRAIGGLPDVEVHGDVPDVVPFYRAADVAIVPLRAGGGTRIKILEAFAHRVPVVATAIGAEGLDMEDGVHALIADDSAAFADACVRLAKSAALRAALADRARRWVCERHATDAVRTAARALFAGG